MTLTDPTDVDLSDDTAAGDSGPLPVEVLPARRDDDGAHSAIEAAARAALEAPGIPGRDEFLSLAMQARIMAGSALVPKALQNRPADVFLVLLTGRDVQIPVTAALRKVHVIDGQTSLAPQLKLALVRRQGLGQVVPVWGSSDVWAGAQAVGPLGLDARCVRKNTRAEARGEVPPGHIADCDCDLLGPPVVVTWEDATAAGLVLDECRPGNHSDRCNQGQGNRESKVKCKQNWRTYPRRMLWWRAAGYCVDDFFPEVSMGLYSPDELGAITDEGGEPIDPSTVALPAGYEDVERRTGGTAAQQQRQREAQAAQHEVADADVLADLAVRIAALPDEQRGKLKEVWKASERVQAYRVDNLPRALTSFVESMLRGFEQLATRAGWDAEAARAAVRASAPTDDAQAAEAPESAAEGDTAADAGQQCQSCGEVVAAVDEGRGYCEGCAWEADHEDDDASDEEQ